MHPFARAWAFRHMNYAARLPMLPPPGIVLRTPNAREVGSPVSEPWLVPWEIREPRRGAYSARRAPARAKRAERVQDARTRARRRKMIDETHELLRVSLRKLRLTMSVITTAVGALRHQNADSDEDVANVLQRCASDRLDIEIEKIAALLARLDRLRRR